jgi:hypothetical protein
MAGSTSKSWWQYSRWVWNIARNMRITEPTGAELSAVREFLKYIWNPVTQTGTREWLQAAYQEKAVGPATDYECDLDNEPTHVLVEILMVVGRDLKKIPLTDAEATEVDTLISNTGNRRYGTGPNFGGVGGSLVTIP